MFCCPCPTWKQGVGCGLYNTAGYCSHLLLNYRHFPHWHDSMLVNNTHSRQVSFFLLICCLCCFVFIFKKSEMWIKVKRLHTQQMQKCIIIVFQPFYNREQNVRNTNNRDWSREHNNMLVIKIQIYNRQQQYLYCI